MFRASATQFKITHTHTFRRMKHENVYGDDEMINESQPATNVFSHTLRYSSVVYPRYALLSVVANVQICKWKMNAQVSRYRLNICTNTLVIRWGLWLYDTILLHILLYRYCRIRSAAMPHATHMWGMEIGALVVPLPRYIFHCKSIFSKKTQRKKNEQKSDPFCNPFRHIIASFAQSSFPSVEECFDFASIWIW